MPSAGRKSSPQALLTLLFVVVIGALIYLNWQVSDMTVDTTAIADKDPTTALQPGAGQAEPAMAPARSEADFPQTVARPLFTPTRRPVERTKPKPEEAKLPPPVVKPPENLQFVGAVRVGNDTMRALIRSDTGATGEWLAVGDEIEGWRLHEIRADAAVVGAGGANAPRYELRLYSSGQGTGGQIR